MEAVYYGVIQEENEQQEEAEQQETKKEFHSKESFAQLRQRAN